MPLPQQPGMHGGDKEGWGIVVFLWKLHVSVPYLLSTLVSQTNAGFLKITIILLVM